jgi:hypothetical protein
MKKKKGRKQLNEVTSQIQMDNEHLEQEPDVTVSASATALDMYV